MSHQDQEDVKSFRQRLLSGFLGNERKTLIANLTLVQDAPPLNFVDPNGVDRDVNLPLREPGQFFYISHVGTANTITVKDAAGATVVILTAGESVLVFCSKQEWVALRSPAWQDLNDFGISGPNHRRGLVPDPGAVINPPSTRKFLSEQGWAEITEISGDDFIKRITDGVNTTTPVGADTFKIRSSDGSIAVTVTNDEAVHGDNVNLTANEANIDHDALLNSFANEHVDHTLVSINTVEGIQGGGTIAATRTLKLDFSNLAAVTPVLADIPAFYDISGLVHGRTTWSGVNAILDHDALVNFVVNKHIDHSAVSISTNVGLSGGGDLTASRTISLDFNALPTDDLPVLADSLAFFDLSELDHGKHTYQQLFNMIAQLTVATPVLTDTVMLGDLSEPTDKGRVATIESVLSLAAGGKLHGQCRLTKSGANLILLPKDGNGLIVNGISATVPDAGVTLAPTGLVVGTTYNIYATASAGVVNALEASTTAHVTSTTAGNKGTEIKSADDTRTLVGMARVVTGPAFADTALQRFVISYFNRRSITASITVVTERTTAVAPWVEISSLDRVEFLTWADEEILCNGSNTCTHTANVNSYSAIGIDGVATRVGDTFAIVWTSSGTPMFPHGSVSLSEGYHFATKVGGTDSGTLTFANSYNKMYVTVRG